MIIMVVYIYFYTRLSLASQITHAHTNISFLNLYISAKLVLEAYRTSTNKKNMVQKNNRIQKTLLYCCYCCGFKCWFHKYIHFFLPLDTGFLPAFVDGSVRGNYGLMDQVAALHWIQENIAEFGGSSTNVTIVGHGRGAACAHLLMLSPMAKGKFPFLFFLSFIYLDISKQSSGIRLKSHMKFV